MPLCFAQVRRKNKELEQPEEISKKALAAFVWPRRAKTPPPSTRNTSRSSRSSRQVDEFGNAAGGMLEQNKKMSPQLSQQAVLSQQAQVIEEITPNWAAAARWLAQAHTHRKAVSICFAARHKYTLPSSSTLRQLQAPTPDLRL